MHDTNMIGNLCHEVRFPLGYFKLRGQVAPSMGKKNSPAFYLIIKLLFSFIKCRDPRKKEL